MANSPLLAPDNSEAAKEVAEFIAQVVKDWVPAPWGNVSAVIISRYGKRPIAYFLPSGASEGESDHYQYERPNFAVVGMGHCGVHVAVALHEMVYKETSDTPPESSAHMRTPSGLVRWARRLFQSAGEKKSLSFKPVMLVGDTDDTTFADVRGLATPREPDPMESKPDASVLTLSYAPLATAGVGNNPIIAQFFTRALLLCPENKIRRGSFGWDDARRFLLAVEPEPRPKEHSEPKEKIPPRLAFYVFSAAGGTGCGAAAEILKAQQFAIASTSQSTLTYYCGVAVLPELREDTRANERKRMLNVGRFVAQYLADQSIILNEENDYTDVPKYRGGSVIAQVLPSNDENAEIHPAEKPPVQASSWNCVLFVSNAIMRPADESLERAVELANQYIAQQLFNLAGPQISARNLAITDRKKLTQKNFETIRLDAMDLLTSLRGPCACCFAAAASKDVKREENERLSWLRGMFLRAMSMPSRREGTGLIEGISVSPCEPKVYADMLSAGSFEEKIARCSELPFFKQCGSLVFTLTAPQDGSILLSELEELLALCAKLFVNLKETRYSAIYGTTEQYTLSMYIEGSVIFAPELQRSFKNYLYLCWPLARRMGETKFEEWWNLIASKKPPIAEADVAAAIGPSEVLDSEYSGLAQVKEVAARSWASVVDQVASTEQARATLLSRLTFDDLSVGAPEIVAALSFYNYFSNRRWLATLK